MSKKVKVIFTTPSFEDTKQKNAGEISVKYGPFDSVRLIYNSLYAGDVIEPFATMKRGGWWEAPDGKVYSDVNLETG